MRIIFTIFAIPLGIVGGLLVGIFTMPYSLTATMIDAIWRKDK